MTAADHLEVEMVSSLSDEVAQELVELLDEALDEDGFSSLSDQARLDSLDGAGDLVMLLGRETAGGPLAGFALLARRRLAWELESAIHPGLRRQEAGAVAALTDVALAHVAARGGGTVRAWLRRQGGGVLDSMRGRGLRPVRELLQLRAPLAAGTANVTGDPPLAVRPFRPGRDEAAWLEVNARAFAGHPEQASWTLADLQRREREPWFDAGGFLVHDLSGRIAGFCWTKVHRAPVLGEIYVIGVDPDFQGRGLGRALTRAGLEHLSARAIPTAMLYVEATNTAALSLYRSLGFGEHHREVVLETVVLETAVAGGGPQVDTPTARPIP